MDDAALQDLIDHIAASVFVIDVGPDGAFRYALINARGESDTGLHRDAIRGRTPGDVLDPEWAERVTRNYQACVDAGEPVRMLDRIDEPTGPRFASTQLFPVFDESGRTVRLFGTSVEITDQIEAQNARERLREVAEATCRLALSISAATSETLPRALSDALAELGPAIGAQRLDLATTQPNTLIIRHWFGWSRSGPARLPRPIVGLPTSEFRFGRRSGERVIEVAELDDLPDPEGPAASFARQIGVASLLAVPLSVVDDDVGWLIASWDQPRGWTAGVPATLTTAAELLYNGIVRARLQEQISRDNHNLELELQRVHDPTTLIGERTGLASVMAQVRQMAKADAPILVQGETGTGKERIARALHGRSTRSARPLVSINCAALTESLAESELFGHERGAFTGAGKRHPGIFERASGGTLFLDEVGELPLPVQGKLLRVLQDGTFNRVGGDRELHTDVRVIAATNRDLEAHVQAGHFRADLYYRLAVLVIAIPPLRDRREDVPELVEHLVQKMAPGRTIRVTDAAMEALTAYPWPGNVRELQNVLQRALVVSSGDQLDTGHLDVPLSVRGSVDELDEVQRSHIVKVLQRVGWNVEAAARALGLPASTLRSRMKRLGVERPH